MDSYGAGHHLRMDSRALRQLRQDLSQLAVAHQRFTADDRHVQRLCRSIIAMNRATSSSPL
jgi:hypothetical protein